MTLCTHLLYLTTTTENSGPSMQHCTEIRAPLRELRRKTKLLIDVSITNKSTPSSLCVDRGRPAGLEHALGRIPENLNPRKPNQNSENVSLNSEPASQG